MSSSLTSHHTHLSSILLFRTSCSALLLFSFLDSCRSFLTLHPPSLQSEVRCRRATQSATRQIAVYHRTTTDRGRIFASYHLKLPRPGPQLACPPERSATTTICCWPVLGRRIPRNVSRIQGGGATRASRLCVRIGRVDRQIRR